MNEIAFTGVRKDFGWLGNMAPYSVVVDGVKYLTSEALFQAWRYPEGDPARELIRAEKSPMAAKMISKKFKERHVIQPMSDEDVAMMYKVLRLKVEQHPELKGMLLATGDATIIEDCSRRQHGSGLFWGAGKQADGTWKGQNILGVLWMRLRTEYRQESHSTQDQGTSSGGGTTTG